MPYSSSQKPQKLTLTSASDLIECERILSRINSATTPTVLLLPKEDRRLFTKDLRVVAIISAASRNSQVKCEWPSNLSAETHQSLIGLAGAVYEVEANEGQVFVSRNGAKQTLAQRLDILENPPGSKETLTFCAIDDTTRAQPVALSALSEKSKFIDELGNDVRKYFDIGPSEDFSSSIGPGLFDDGSSVEECIYGFVYELYQNTFVHGSLDQDQKTIPGLRLLRVRKRIGQVSSRDAFIRGAGQFSELQEYLEENLTSDKTFKLYEISISDNGMGILSRFRSIGQAEPPKEAQAPSENLKLLNRIIAESLSSDSRKSNVGRGGLQKALDAVDKVKGFVSLRTDNLWVYRSPENTNATSPEELLRPVRIENGGELSKIPGTHFSMIVRAS
ncbi:MAG: hypothetical protein OXB94_06930 [Nitrospira sp.]|nr:hypothetical protein [Nitrospira sp.]